MGKALGTFAQIRDLRPEAFETRKIASAINYGERLVAYGRGCDTPLFELIGKNEPEDRMIFVGRIIGSSRVSRAKDLNQLLLIVG